jgi:hypothetical protein
MPVARVAADVVTMSCSGLMENPVDFLICTCTGFRVSGGLTPVYSVVPLVLAIPTYRYSATQVSFLLHVWQ